MKYIYYGSKFKNVKITPKKYRNEYFEDEINLESELFYELRRSNNIIPFKLKDSTELELEEIRKFFIDNKETFLCVLENKKLIASILYINNYIQCLAVEPSFQRNGLGTELTKYVVNKILDQGNKKIELDVLEGNEIAIKMYKKLGFTECI